MPDPATVGGTMNNHGFSQLQEPCHGRAEVTNRNRSRCVQIQIRSLLRFDFPEVLAIEARSPESRRSMDDIIHCLCQPYCLGDVAEDRRGRLVGFMVHKMLRKRLHVVSLAFHLDFGTVRSGRR